jgi:hypothetical protein
MKTLLIEKLAPTYKNYVLPQEPDSLNADTNMTRAMWKHKYPAGYVFPKIHSLTMSSITSEIKNSLQNLAEDIRDEYIIAIITKGTTNTTITIRATTRTTTTTISKIVTMSRNTKIKPRKRTNHHQPMGL